VAVETIGVVFDSVRVLDDGDFWGAGEWKLDAKVDGQRVGNPNEIFEAREDTWIDLPDDAWFVFYDVSEKCEGDEVEIVFKATEDDVLFDDDLGTAWVKLKWPFKMEFDRTIKASKVSGLFSSTRYFEVRIKVFEVPTERASLKFDPVFTVSRGRSGGDGNYSTVNSSQIFPRVEICPVIPTPAIMPPRQRMPVDFPSGESTPHANPVRIGHADDLNTQVNPAVIPHLSATDPDLRKKAARIAVTYIEPRNLDKAGFRWTIKFGPIEFVDKNNDGKDLVLVRGTGEVDAEDEMAEIELRWISEDGPVLATFRAWAGPIKTVWYRINIVKGVDPVNHPERSPNMSPNDVHRYAKISRIMLWQAGIDFQPDPVTTCWDNASAAGEDGVFYVSADDDSWTNNVPLDPSPFASRLNFRPRVINVTFVRSHVQNRAYASDIRGVSGDDETLDGTPSNSWVIPSGIRPDSAAGEVTMRTFRNRPRNNSTDGDYVTARRESDPDFTEDDMQLLYACMYPSIWGGGFSPLSRRDLLRAANLVHELGHVFGLHHRGNANNPDPPVSLDGVNTIDESGDLKGHPWQENIMSYGRDRALDIDLMQARKIRLHPSANL
jgi:hypothetical protein